MQAVGYALQRLGTAFTLDLAKAEKLQQNPLYLSTIHARTLSQTH